MSKVKNPKRRCKLCGGKCNKRMRYCVACAIQRKAARVGIDRKLAQVTARAQFLVRRDLEAKAAGGVAVRVSVSRTGLRIESRGNCAGGCATNIPHT